MSCAIASARCVLPDPAGTGEGDQPDILLRQERRDDRHFALAADQARRGTGERHRR